MIETMTRQRGRPRNTEPMRRIPVHVPDFLRDYARSQVALSNKNLADYSMDALDRWIGKKSGVRRTHPRSGEGWVLLNLYCSITTYNRLAAEAAARDVAVSALLYTALMADHEVSL